jgi:hypothetical protein
MIPVADLIRDHRGLVNELMRYDYSSVAPLIGGFLTLPNFHANTLRLDTLAHLACYACAGKRMADREMLMNCAGRHFVGSQLILMSLRFGGIRKRRRTLEHDLTSFTGS